MFPSTWERHQRGVHPLCDIIKGQFPRFLKNGRRIFLILIIREQKNKGWHVWNEVKFIVQRKVILGTLTLVGSTSLGKRLDEWVACCPETFLMMVRRNDAHGREISGWVKRLRTGNILVEETKRGGGTLRSAASGWWQLNDSRERERFKILAANKWLGEEREDVTGRKGRGGVKARIAGNQLWLSGHRDGWTLNFRYASLQGRPRTGWRHILLFGNVAKGIFALMGPLKMFTKKHQGYHHILSGANTCPKCNIAASWARDMSVDCGSIVAASP